MTIQPIGDHAATLTLSAADLGGAAPEAITPPEALHLIRDALFAAGLKFPGPLELDAFPDGAGLLLFVRSLPQPPARPLPVRAYRRGRVGQRGT